MKRVTKHKQPASSLPFDLLEELAAELVGRELPGPPAVLPGITIPVLPGNTIPVSPLINVFQFIYQCLFVYDMFFFIWLLFSVSKPAKA